MRPTTWRRSTHVLIGVGVLALVAVVVAVAALLTGGGQSTSGAAQVMPAPAAVSAKPAVAAVADDAPKPTPSGMTAALAPALANPDLGAFTGRVTDALTGTQLWEQGATLPMQPASVTKVLTAAAALLTLDRDARVTTTVVADQQRQPGLVVLVGAGDPTLSGAPADGATLYRDAGRISDLADQIKKSGIKVTSVAVDTTAYSGPTMAPGWNPVDIDGGDVAPMESVMVDCGRVQPLTPESVRSTTPALDAGRALAGALGVNPQTVTNMVTSTDAWHQIASVQSAPLIERLRQMMNGSDNVMAESIAREVAMAMHRPASFAGAVEAVTSRLAAAKVDMTGANLMDGSGLSVDDRLTATTLDDIIGEAAGPDQPPLRPLLDLLPIAGGSGTLSNRFTDGAPTEIAAGWLRAKTGSLTGTNSLAGIVTDVNGRVLTFTWLSNNAGPTGLTAIDNLAATLRSCGCGG